MRYVGETERMEVILDTDEQVVWVTQKWRCNFLNMDRSIKKWTEVEMTAYKRKLKELLQKMWSEKAYAIVNSQKGSPFNEKYGKSAFPIKINIDFVNGGEHWEVRIVKVKNVEQETAFIHWDDRVVYLNNLSIKRHQYCFLNNSPDPGSFFWPATHEFGHMLGNTQYTDGGMGDEYPTLHLLHQDVCSIMNVGNEVRHRHFSHIRDILQKIIPGTYFCIRLS